MLNKSEAKELIRQAEINENRQSELVRKAADALTEVYGPQWPAWMKLWRLSMLSMHRCVVAQVEKGSGLLQEEAIPFSMGVRRMYRAGVTTDSTRAFIVSPGDSVRSRRIAWKREIRKRRSVVDSPHPVLREWEESLLSDDD